MKFLVVVAMMAVAVSAVAEERERRSLLVGGVVPIAETVGSGSIRTTTVNLAPVVSHAGVIAAPGVIGNPGLVASHGLIGNPGLLLAPNNHVLLG